MILNIESRRGRGQNPGLMRLVWQSFLFIALFSFAARAAEMTLSFSKMPTGVPKGFRSALTAGGEPGNWQIIEAEGPTGLPTVTSKAEAPRQNVLAQLGRDPTDARYPILIMEEGDFGDFTVTTRFKLVAGVVEQMAGIAFRIKDEKNYYYVRASGLYNTVALIPVLNGQLLVPAKADVQIAKDAWHELKIKAEGNRFTVFFNGRQVIETSGDLFSVGKIGFWTKSDSVSYFADTHIVYRPLQSLAEEIAQQTIAKYDKLHALRIVGYKGGDKPQVVASSRAEELGQAASDVEADVLKNAKKYFGRPKDKNGTIIVTLPLADRNGETIAAVRLEMDSFKGQTQENAIARALPIIREMEYRIARAPDVTGF